MDLQLSVFLLFILFTAGHSIRCYECTNHTLTCADQQVITCPELSACFSYTEAGLIEGNTTKAKIKGCISSNACPYSSFSSADISSFCCNTDLCNANDAELSGDSSPDIPNDPNPLSPNGKKCYRCVGESCLYMMNCSGSQDRCLTGTVTFQGHTFAVNGCATKEVCDAITSVSSVECCEGNLCNRAQSATMSVTQSSTNNGAQSVTQSFLFLCCSLLSYFLLH